MPGTLASVTGQKGNMGIVSNAETSKSENYTDLLVTYRAMLDLRRGPNFDDTRYHRLENKVNDLWAKLSNLEQKQAVKELVFSGHMEQRIADILVMFDGRIDMSDPPEPCWRA